MKPTLPKSPFACRMFSKAGCGRGQGSTMNSLRSALTAVLAGQPTLKCRRRETLNLAAALQIYSLSNWYKIPGRSYVHELLREQNHG